MEKVYNTNEDLIKFIDKEKNVKKVSYKKIINYFFKCIIKSFTELEKKLNLDNKNNNTILRGIDMIHNIYFNLLYYSSNLKLTIFLIDRSLLLFSEFIIMSSDKKIIDQISFKPNITDAIVFSYKKTIGPININLININPVYKQTKNICLIIKNVYQTFYLNNKKNFNKLFIELQILLEPIMFELFQYINDNNCNYIINYIKSILDIPYENKLELLNIILKNMCYYLKNFNQLYFKICFNKIYKIFNNIEHEKLEENILSIVNSYQKK